MGTRPEIIKFAPLVLQLRQIPSIETLILSTGQHDSMALQAFDDFGLRADIDLCLMQKEQTPNSFLARLLHQLEPHFKRLKPTGIVVQGDTTSAMGAALCAFHLKLPVAHLEAGLRTYNLDSPFPEEMNRCIISKIASLHFCPTARSVQNLKKEGVAGEVFLTGNTVIDAALQMSARLGSGAARIAPQVQALDLKNRSFVLVTGHRQENFDGPLTNLCRTLCRLRDKIPYLQLVFPVHLNPRVQDTVYRELRNETRIHLLPPVDYPSFIWLIQHAALIITDSGGIQEEAPSFGTPVIVTRACTERPEAIDSGCCILRSLQNPEALFETAVSILSHGGVQETSVNPFGDGNAAKQIAEILAQSWMGLAAQVKIQPQEKDTRPITIKSAQSALAAADLK